MSGQYEVQEGMLPQILSRRNFLKAAAAAGLMPVALTQPAPAAGAAETTAGGKRFLVGDFEALVIGDGDLGQGDPAAIFNGRSEDEIRAALRDAFLDDRNMTLDQNVLVLRHGERTILFDTGTGGAPIFGDKPGKLVGGLRAAGVEPAAVTDVVISHAHPDHVWGLTDEREALNFPNAAVHLSAVDHAFFGDETNDRHPIVGPFNPLTRAELAAVKDRLNLLKDGQEAVPGVTALAAPGHSPGHMIFAIHSGSETLMLTADLAHHHVMHTRFPDIKLAYDTDPDEMVRTRIRFFDMLATDRLKFIAYHFPYPGIGHLRKNAEGYEWIPASIDTV
jgi:glyoxylase-like metal-dependent hydrolase (beta-lactamase superfamily II)